MADLISLIKKAAVDAVEGEKPAGVLFGTVTSISPLQVNVEQRLTLSGEMLVCTFNVSDYSVELDVNWQTGSGGDPSHSHAVIGKKTATVKNGLKIGEKVILLRMQGGQRFLILDRVRESE